MNVDEGTGLVHFTGEHTPEFKFGDIGFQRMDVVFNGIQRLLVIFLGGKLKQLAGILQRAGHVVQGANDLFEANPFTAQVLGTFRIVPDLRFLQFADDFSQSFNLAVEVKDTP